MTSKERFLTAIQNGTPDQVPMTPDISNYIPVARRGGPFWEVYFERAEPLWKLYIDAAEYYGLDMWIGSCAGVPVVTEGPEPQVELRMADERDAMIRATTWETPDGPLAAEDICFRREPPTHRTRIIKNLEQDWPKYRHLISGPVDIDRVTIDEVRRAAAAKEQAFGLGIGYPGFHGWEGKVEGSVQTLTYAFADTPEILDEWADLQLARGTRVLELFLEEKPDYVQLGGSGTLTLASPELARRYALPAIARYSAMCKKAGVPTVLHSCGRSRELVNMLADNTDVDCINPLEMAPMGDVDLAEVKRARGKDIALMGNLHTTDTMLHGTKQEVYEAARDALLAAREGGGFVLSTGDQCPRETPEENLFVLHEAVTDFGVY